MKRQPTEQENIFAKYTADTSLILRVIKNSRNSKNQVIHLRNVQRIRTGIFSKAKIQVANRHNKKIFRLSSYQENAN